MTSPDGSGVPDRPARPAYGEYAEPGDPRFAPPPSAPPPVAPPTARTTSPRPRGSRDALASAVLLGFGAMVTVIVVSESFQLDRVFEEMYRYYGGVGAYTPAGDLVLARNVLVVSHVVLLAAAFLITRARLRAGRLTFWVPLVAGVLAAIVYLATFTVILSVDEALMEAGMNIFIRR